jgi:LDH2 family malate/lactate/ureidoglycolate dehydrogenase
VLAAMRTDLFMTGDEFRNRMDAILGMLKSAPAGPGVDRVLVPGEIELSTEARLREQGIELPPQIATELARFGESLGVPFPSGTATMDTASART